MFTTNVGDHDGDGRDDVTRAPLAGGWLSFYSSTEPLPEEPTWTHDHLHDPGAQYGRYHAGYGDFNDDGFSDFGIRYVDPQAFSIFDLYLGSEELDSTADHSHAVSSETGFEWSHRFIGDVNGDGYDDIMSNVLVSGLNDWWNVYYGSETVDFEADVEINWQSLTIPAFTTPLGDINQDGYDDLSVWSPNQVYVLLGGNPFIGLSAWLWEGPEDGFDIGARRVGPAGDFNGDGIDDWMVGSFDYSSNRGRITVIAGDPRFGLAVDSPPAHHPTSIVLHPCYPNPFNAQTTIAFTVPPGAPAVELVVFNTLGQVVYRVPTEVYPAGVHRHMFDGSDLGTGLYFVRVMAGNEVRTGKMVLLR